MDGKLSIIRFSNIACSNSDHLLCDEDKEKIAQKILGMVGGI